MPCEDLMVALRCDHLQCKLPLGKVIWMLIYIIPICYSNSYSHLSLRSRSFSGVLEVFGVISESHMWQCSLPTDNLAAVALLIGTATSGSLLQ